MDFTKIYQVYTFGSLILCPFTHYIPVYLGIPISFGAVGYLTCFGLIFIYWLDDLINEDLK